MHMIRTVITPENTDVHISVPQSYVGKKVEVLLYSADEVVEDRQPAAENTMARFWNIISKETGNDLHESSSKSRSEWERDT